MPPKIALTYDDGPDEQWTPKLLDELALHRASATFFVISRRAGRHPELIERMVGEGHSVQLHCAQHLRHTRISASELEDDTAEALATLSQLGIAPTLWRTPWGVQGAATAAVAAAHGLGLVRWSYDTEDWAGHPAHAMLDRLEPAVGPALSS